jgi:hypothetical protein
VGDSNGLKLFVIDPSVLEKKELPWPARGFARFSITHFKEMVNASISLNGQIAHQKDKE